MVLVQVFDQGVWISQELIEARDLKALEDAYALQGYECRSERVGRNP